MQGFETEFEHSLQELDDIMNGASLLSIRVRGRKIVVLVVPYDFRNHTTDKRAYAKFLDDNWQERKRLQFHTISRSFSSLILKNASIG